MITFTDTLGRTVKIYNPHGAGDIYFVMVAEYFVAQIVKQGGVWRAYPGNAGVTGVTADDLQVFIEKVQEHESGKPLP